MISSRYKIFLFTVLPLTILSFSILIDSCKKAEQVADFAGQKTPLLEFNKTDNSFDTADIKIIGEHGFIYQSWDAAIENEKEVVVRYRSGETSAATPYCCEVYWAGYQPPPFPVPGNPSLMTFRTLGYNVPEANSYFFQFKIYRFNINTQEWDLFYDRLWEDDPRECDGQNYYTGLSLDLGACAADFRVFGAKGHYENGFVYCTGAWGQFHYPGNPNMPCF